jgi:transcriptional regulator with GAF, ATPase, and Fis domain
MGLDASNGADIFAQLAVDLHGSDGVTETVDMVVQFALQALDCTHAGVVFAARGGRAEVAAVTDPALVDIYLDQVNAGHGPLVAALIGLETVLIRDTATDERWPAWTGRVRDLGVGSVLDVPMNVSHRTVGVLGLYSSRTDAFDTDDEAIAHILARHAAVALATARHEEALTRAVDARKLVGQAMGILMERYHLDSDQAFAVLRRYSQRTNTKLRLIAQELIDTRTLPGQGHPSDQNSRAPRVTAVDRRLIGNSHGQPGADSDNQP